MASEAAANSESSKEKFGPLTFENSSIEQLSKEITCVLCDNTFNLLLSFEIFVNHLFEVHNLVIEEIQSIENLPEYIKFWREKLQKTPVEEIIPSIKIGVTNNKFFLLSSLLKEDKELRHRIKLNHTLQVQEFERTDAKYLRQCLFCRLSFEGTRPQFLEHLSSEHNLQLGNPQNLVYIEQLVDKIAEKLDQLQCIFCDRTFPERTVLKEHMRKKLHKRVNRHNKEYDRFYIVNYLEADRKWRAIQKEDDSFAAAVNETEGANSDVEYSDWNEKEDAIICLFCSKKENDINTLCLHMEADHEFDFAELTKHLDFYQKVKFVNYVRRQTHNKKCFYCDVECRNGLEEHFAGENHLKMPEIKAFDQPEFYFPTYENDAFLYFIDDVED